MTNLHENCDKCTRITLDNNCAVYPKPEYWWEKRGGCPLATHTKTRVIEEKKVNPLKASKRKMAGK